jgi:hypothetical protein
MRGYRNRIRDLKITQEDSLKYESIYADDLDLLDENEERLSVRQQILTEELEQNRLKVNGEKTVKYIFPLHNQTFNNKIKKLGSMLDSKDDITYRIQNTSYAFSKYWKLWLRREHVKLPTRLRMYNSCVLPVMLYNAGCLDLCDSELHKLDVLQRKHIRIILGIFYPNIIHNYNLYKMTNQMPISVQIVQKRLTILGHVLRLKEDIPTYKAMEKYFMRLYVTKYSKFSKRHPATIVSLINQDLKYYNANYCMKNKTNLQNLRAIAQDRKIWQNIVNAIVSSKFQQYMYNIKNNKNQKRTKNIRTYDQMNRNEEEIINTKKCKVSSDIDLQVTNSKKKRKAEESIEERFNSNNKRSRLIC